MTNLYSIGEVADILELPSPRIVYAHQTRKIEEPPRILGRRAYTWGEIERFAEHFDIDLPKQEVNHERN